MFGIGIIGCGKIAQVRHIPEYLENPNAEIRGYFDLNLQRAQELAEKFGGKAFASVEELLSDPSIDAVSVCVANFAHAEMTIKALEAGKHVLCEKPMAVTLAECEAMVAAAKKAGKHLMIGHNQRLAKAHMVAKKMIEEGAIGRILTFRTTFGHGGPETWSIDPGKSVWFFDKKRAAMGAMADLGIHKTDLIQFLTGQKVVRTTARLTTLDKRDAGGNLIGVDDNAFCIYELSGGAYGTMTASWTYYAAEDNSTILYGTKGTMRIYDDPAHSIVVNKSSGETEYYDVEQIQTNDNQTKSGIIDLWMEALVQDKEPEISGESALSAMRAVFASLVSSEKGCTVEIPENM
ncbi:MAG TPA: Gfo/Idh/MocA family oxidoreductase [Candidatus Faecousia faecipullorum]|nr:Gfo/Idh/MocA family oxidoreductase [Candidatus Faecousia faecipullorum]